MGSNTFNSTANTSWTAPGTVANNTVLVEVWGSGGGGGSNNATGTGAGGGAGGGGYSNGTVIIVPGNVYALAIGLGGAVGANANSNGVSGANTSFNNNTGGNTSTAVLARGGVAGNRANTAGAGANTTSAVGTTTRVGGGGAAAASGAGGGGGAAGGAAGAGEAAAGTTGGSGANGGGPGGNGGAANANANNATLPGGGGGGSGNGTLASKHAGNGANGQVTITWTDVTIPTATSSEASSITYASAIANGALTVADEAAIERGVVYATATHADPGNVAPGSSGYSGLVNETVGGYVTGSFSETLSGLAPLTTYFYRVYARTRAGYDYSNTEQSFATPSAPTFRLQNYMSIKVGTGLATGEKIK